MFSWTSLFSDDVLKRGKSYYDEVNNVKRIDNRIITNIKGQYDYFVSVTLNGDKIKSVSCNCYYDGNCEHEVALLHYIDEHDWLLNCRTDDSYINLINSMDVNILR